MNPAVTLATSLTGHMSWGRGGLYMVAQLLGGIFGALIEVSASGLPQLLVTVGEKFAAGLLSGSSLRTVNVQVAAGEA